MHLGEHVRLEHHSGRRPGESGGLAQFAGSDAFRWRKRTQGEEAAEGTEPGGSRLVVVAMILLALGVAAGVAFVMLRR